MIRAKESPTCAKNALQHSLEITQKISGSHKSRPLEIIHRRLPRFSDITPKVPKYVEGVGTNSSTRCVQAYLICMQCAISGWSKWCVRSIFWTKVIVPSEEESKHMLGFKWEHNNNATVVSRGPNSTISKRITKRFFNVLYQTSTNQLAFSRFILGARLMLINIGVSMEKHGMTSHPRTFLTDSVLHK